MLWPLVVQMNRYADLLHEDGPTGYFGGSTPIQEFLFFADFDDTGFTDFIKQRIYQSADLQPNDNGSCQEISTAFDFTAVNAHLYANE